MLLIFHAKNFSELCAGIFMIAGVEWVIRDTLCSRLPFLVFIHPQAFPGAMGKFRRSERETDAQRGVSTTVTCVDEVAPDTRDRAVF